MIDVLPFAEAVVEAAIKVGLDRQVERDHPLTWRQGARFALSDNHYTRALGYSIMLSAILASPDAPALLIRSLRDLMQGVYDEAA